MSEYRLIGEIISLSQSSSWEEAKQEWQLSDVYQAEEAETCLCGHYPIIELCILRNRHNDRDAIVGNCCVKKFIGLPSDLIFQAVKRIRSDNEKSLNSEALTHAINKGWINKWEHDFYHNIMRKRLLSQKQMTAKRNINLKFINNMRRLTANVRP